MSRFLNILIIMGMILGLAHCALGPGEFPTHSTAFENTPASETEVFEDPTSPTEEVHQKDPGEYDPGSVGEEPGTKVDIPELPDEEVLVGEDSDQDYTVESYCGEERYECEQGAEPIERAVCKAEYEDCVDASNCEVQQTVCLLNQYAPDSCQRQFDQCDCRNAKHDCLIQGENRELCESLYPSC
jgi:hypothetical protein